MDLEYELLREFDRVVSQCDRATNMPSNLDMSDNTLCSEEQDSVMLSVTKAKNETLEVMKVAAPAERNDVLPLLDKSIPQFLSKVYEIVDDRMTDHVVHWGFEGKSFVVQDALTFCNVILPKYYKHGNFSSFIRQLNTYGFRKIDCDKWEFAAREFQRGKIHQLQYIKRRTSANKNMGIRSGKHDESFQKYLKGLSAQMANLSQQVEVCNSIISEFEKRMQVIELKCKHMACVLLSKATQNPGFVADRLKRKASLESKHGGDGETEIPSDQTMAETHDTPKLSSESTQLLSNCNATAQSPNQTEVQLSVHMPAPSFGESSRSPNGPHGSSVDDRMESLDNDLMNEMEPCEEMGSEKCTSYYLELASLIAVDESNDDWLAYAAKQAIDKKP